MTFTANIYTVRHDSQRYNTAGDWMVLGDMEGAPRFAVTVSYLGDWRMEALIAVHELIECLLCHHAGITDAQVTGFDKAWEAARDKLQSETGIVDLAPAEPGNDYACPYKHQHAIASAVERLLAAELGVSWEAYEQKVNSLA